jgi:NADPH-dependent curcumin reductase CurA
MSIRNRQCLLAARPVGLPKPTDWEFVHSVAADPADGEFLVEVEHLSIDPGMRPWMSNTRSYVAPVDIGDVMRAAAVGRVVKSRHAGFDVGDHVTGFFGVQEYAVSDGQDVTLADLKLGPPASHLGVLGLSGLTAYFGLVDKGAPQPGETVVVSGAAGAVGSVAGQIAKSQGCRTIGIAGGEAKCQWLVEELGFDAAIDYKSQDVRRRLRDLAPDGVDVFFDNVGGEILDDVLARLALHARIVLCGAVSQYNATSSMRGPANYMQLLVARASMAGFVVFDYAERHPEALDQLAQWLRSGDLKAYEQVIEADIDAFPEVLLRLFRGENTGKLVMALPSASTSEASS